MVDGEGVTIGALANIVGNEYMMVDGEGCHYRSPS